MTIANNDTIKDFNEIIQLLYDGERCYRGHINNVKEESLKQLFSRLIESRKKMIEEMQGLVNKLGEKIDEVKGTTLGSLHKIYENLKSMLTNGNPLVIAKEIKRGENILIESYKNALTKVTDKNDRNILINHVSEIEDELKQVDLLAIKVSHA